MSSNKLNLDAYYYSFEPTGVDAVDTILSAVANAGAGYHNTADWREQCDDGSSPLSEMQAAAEKSAEAFRALVAENERLAKKLDHNDYYCATRFETLFHWAHRELSESQKNQYFSIVANGSSYPDDPPTYAQQMNRLKWRVEAAEKERDMLKAENERLRKLPTCWSEVLEQSEANDQLLDQVLELSADADRYRFLRDKADGPSVRFIDMYVRGDKRLDTYLDALMSEDGK